MGYATILGLDLGKFKSVCCVMDLPSGRHAFDTLASTPAAIHDLLTRQLAAGGGEELLLVIETCDAAGWVHDVACATPVSVAFIANRQLFRPLGHGHLKRDNVVAINGRSRAPAALE